MLTGIAVAGGLGAGLRFLLDTAITKRLRSRFPWGIAVVNLSGSLALGLLVGSSLGDPVLSVFAVGLLGGYTTFSTASVDTLRLLMAGRVAAALVNGLGLLLACVVLAVIGILLTSG